MARVSIDSNIVIYAELEPDTDKGKRALDVIGRATSDGVIRLQALGEVLRYVQRRAPGRFEDTLQRVSVYRTVFHAAVTTDAVFTAASNISRVHHLQFWDAVICAESIGAGASVLLTEDMQDGRMIDGLRIINPFDAANTKAVEAIFAG